MAGGGAKPKPPQSRLAVVGAQSRLEKQPDIDCRRRQASKVAGWSTACVEWDAAQVGRSEESDALPLLLGWGAVCQILTGRPASEELTGPKRHLVYSYWFIHVLYQWMWIKLFVRTTFVNKEKQQVESISDICLPSTLTLNLMTRKIKQSSVVHVFELTDINQHCSSIITAEKEFIDWDVRSGFSVKSLRRSPVRAGNKSDSFLKCNWIQLAFIILLI